MRENAKMGKDEIVRAPRTRVEVERYVIKKKVEKTREKEMKFQISKLANLAQCSAAVSSSSLEWNEVTVRL